ncbi:MAG: PH domain-containing protein [Pseudomonadota bacterium]
MREFSAPWSILLKATTGICVLILCGIAVVGLVAGPRKLLWQLAVVGLPLTFLFLALPFTILGYRIERDVLKVRRLGWATSIPLDGLRSVHADPDAMARSLRVFGNGGLFCFAGRFRNQALGNYRAWATDPGNAVVLKFDDRTLVVTPGRRNAFVFTLTKLIDPPPAAPTTAEQ